MNKNVLYLGSNSSFRKMLLEKSKIPFVVVGHTADEESVDSALSLEDQVRYLAQLKMDHITIPDGTYEDEVCYILTADTMRAREGYGIHSKPVDYADAYQKIESLSGLQKTATGYCIDKRVWQKGKWKVDARICDTVTTLFKFKVPSLRIDDYFKNTPAFDAAGAIMTEDYGMQFLEYINGSASGIVGIPLYEVRTMLENLGFFS